MKPIIPLLLTLITISACQSPQSETSMVSQLPFSIKAQDGEEQAKGHVYHDQNENRVKDANEPGIAGVAVSNGTDIVHTNAEGAWELPVSDDAVIFVVKPKDWMTPVNEDFLPQFYYLHKPNGYPANYNYKATEPTGPLPEEINFPLYAENGAEDFKIVVFGDPQPYNITQVDFFAEDIVTELIGRTDLEFGITMGDIVGDDLELFSPLNQAVANIGIPWYNVLGNHDVNYMAPNDKMSSATFEEVFGPATYAFVYGQVHFIIIDDVIHADEAGSRSYVGGLRPDQFEFVANYLETVPKEDLIVMSMHIPLVEHGESFRQSDQKKLFDLLKTFPNTLSISAHTHVQENKFFQKDSTDWQREEPHHHFNVGTTSGSWWNGMRNENDVPHTMMRDGTPNGYSFISFKGAEYVIDWQVAGSPMDHQMNIHVPRGIVSGAADTTLLTVNFFNGSEEAELSYRINGSEWQPMQQVFKPDPYYAKLGKRWQRFKAMKFREQWDADTTVDLPPIDGWDLPQPVISSHLWEANIGTDWPAGRHLIEVQAKDRYGRTFSAYHMMRVEE
jgi:hypothetical protein